MVTGELLRNPGWAGCLFKFSLMQVENFLMAKSLDALCQDHDGDRDDDDARLINFYALIFAWKTPSLLDFVAKKTETETENSLSLSVAGRAGVGMSIK